MHDDDPRNGDRPSMHPEAVEALAVETAHRQAADERWIQNVEEGVKEVRDSLGGFRAGTTEWQQGVSRQLKLITNQIQLLMAARIAWPALRVMGALALGGFAAELVWRLTTSH